MIEITVDNMNLRQIAESGQAFRWNQLDESGYHYSIVAYSKYLEITQTGTKSFLLDCTEMWYMGFWRHYFDLDTDYETIQTMAAQGDDLLREAAAQGCGIRILRQPIFETIITFLVSQNNNIPRIKATIEKLCERFGRKCTAPGGQQYYAFPEPKDLADIDKLQGLGLGYRDKYIAAAARIAASGCINIAGLEAEDYSTAKLILTNFLGVGEKVADCICLFALHKLEAFPVDTWVKKIEEKYYGGRFPQEKYEGYQGIMQQYLFAYIRKTEKERAKQ